MGVKSSKYKWAKVILIMVGIIWIGLLVVYLKYDRIYNNKYSFIENEQYFMSEKFNFNPIPITRKQYKELRIYEDTGRYSMALMVLMLVIGIYLVKNKKPDQY